MTGKSWARSLLEAIKEKAAEILTTAALVFLRWLVERLTSNPGHGGGDASEGE